MTIAIVMGTRVFGPYSEVDSEDEAILYLARELGNPVILRSKDGSYTLGGVRLRFLRGE